MKSLNHRFRTYLARLSRLARFYAARRVENRRSRGFSLVDALIGVGLFAVFAVGIYQAYRQSLIVVNASRSKIAAAALANELLEVARNMPYADVGLISGLPPGKISREQDLVRDGRSFRIITTIRNIDDPFDGTVGGAPNDLSPADYKLVELEISCASCRNFQPLILATRVAPKNLETASANGALFIQVIDANGNPVRGADIHVENNQASPAIVIADVSNNDGLLQIVDAPPGAEAYEITVSKAGYSGDRTYASGEPANPNPLKPHATVAVQQLTQTSFAIDRVSTAEVSSATMACATVGNIDFNLKGAKLIGQTPDVLKYDVNHMTDGAGRLSLPGLEWDNYNLTLTDAAYDLTGAVPFLPLNLGAGATQDLKLIVAPKNPRSLLVTVKDTGTALPLTGAAVTLERGAFSQTLVTGRGALRQTDWSGGDGQEDFVDESRYFSSDAGIDFSTSPGELRLQRFLGEYEPSGSLISSTFDTGAPSNFYQITWEPQDQPPQTGPDAIRFQIAANNDRVTWNFLGPDGTPGSFYTLADNNINPIHNDKRFIRYKVFLQTADTHFTPNLAEVALTFNSSCLPPGQVMFSGLGPGTYTLSASLVGYQNWEESIDLASPWQERQISLLPQ